MLNGERHKIWSREIIAMVPYGKNKYKIFLPWMMAYDWFSQHGACAILPNSFRNFRSSSGKCIKYFWGYLTNKYTHLNRVDSYIKRAFLKHKDKLGFLKALINNPRAIGAVYPSSKYLAKEMASHVFQENDGLVIELGAGTGVIGEF